MARDKKTRPCRDCGEQKPSFEWCDTCAAFVCDECAGQHDCIGDALSDMEPEEIQDCPASHTPDCDDPVCDGACLEGEDLEDQED
jgi:hypothetical protein